MTASPCWKLRSTGFEFIAMAEVAHVRPAFSTDIIAGFEFTAEAALSPHLYVDLRRLITVPADIRDNKYVMDPFFSLRTTQAQAVAARDFEAPFMVTIPFRPGWPSDQHLLDRATTFALAAERLGRTRRTVDARAGEATWCFENGRDAVEFALKFP